MGSWNAEAPPGQAGLRFPCIDLRELAIEELQEYTAQPLWEFLDLIQGETSHGQLSDDPFGVQE